MYLMVLDDGETYSGLFGCKIVNLPSDYSSEQIEDTLDEIRRGDPELKEKHIVTDFQ